MSSFLLDDDEQRKVRDRFLVPFYKVASKGRFVLLDGGGWARAAQIAHTASDTLVQHPKTGEAVMIEEKIMRLPKKDGYFFPNLLFEVEKPGGHPGWSLYLNCDKLVYAFVLPVDRLDVYFFDWPPLKEWFAEGIRCDDFETLWLPDGAGRDFLCAKVPIAKALKAAEAVRWLVTPGGYAEMLPVFEERWRMKHRVADAAE